MECDCDVRNCIPEYTPPDCTDIIQVVDDSAMGNQGKTYLNQNRDEFLCSSTRAWDEWAAMSASDKRVRKCYLCICV